MVDDDIDREAEVAKIVDNYGSAEAAVKDGALSEEEANEFGYDLPEYPEDLDDPDKMEDYWDRNG